MSLLVDFGVGTEKDGAGRLWLLGRSTPTRGLPAVGSPRVVAGRASRSRRTRWGGEGETANQYARKKSSPNMGTSTSPMKNRCTKFSPSRVNRWKAVPWRGISSLLQLQAPQPPHSVHGRGGAKLLGRREIADPVSRVKSCPVAWQAAVTSS